MMIAMVGRSSSSDRTIKTSIPSLSCVCWLVFVRRKASVYVWNKDSFLFSRIEGQAKLLDLKI